MADIKVPTLYLRNAGPNVRTKYMLEKPEEIYTCSNGLHRDILTRYSPNGEIMWRNEFDGDQRLIAIDNNYIYNGNRIIDKTDGTLKQTIEYDSNSYMIISIDVDSKYLYWAGYHETGDYIYEWWIRIIDKNTLQTVMDILEAYSSESYPEIIKADDANGIIYAGGEVYNDVTYQYDWRFEKRDRDNGTLLSYAIDPKSGTGNEVFYDIVIGSDAVFILTNDKDQTVCIRKFNKNDNSVLWTITDTIAYTASGLGLGIDNSNNIYIVSFEHRWWNKFNGNTGDLIIFEPYPVERSCWRIAVNKQGNVYLAGRLTISNYYWFIQKWSITDSNNLLWENPTATSLMPGNEWVTALVIYEK